MERKNTGNTKILKYCFLYIRKKKGVRSKTQKQNKNERVKKGVEKQANKPEVMESNCRMHVVKSEPRCPKWIICLFSTSDAGEEWKHLTSGTERRAGFSRPSLKWQIHICFLFSFFLSSMKVFLIGFDLQPKTQDMSENNPFRFLFVIFGISFLFFFSLFCFITPF